MAFKSSWGEQLRKRMSISRCSLCYNLDFDHLPRSDPPLSLDEHEITITFLQLKASAQNGNCLACMIIHTGIEEIQADWEESEYLLDTTRLLINLRQGHCARVTILDYGYEKVLEFYTIDPKGNNNYFGMHDAC